LPNRYALNDIVASSDGKNLEGMYNKDAMQKQSGLFNKISTFFFPPDFEGSEEFKDVIPFFILITAAMGWMYVVYIRQIESGWLGVLFTLLMLVHLTGYWLVFRFVHYPRQLRWYFFVQGMLAFVLTLMAADYGLVIGLYSALIGNAAGALRKLRDIVFVVLGSLVLGVISISIRAGFSIIAQWSFIAIPSIILSGFIAFMFRRQLESRERTQKLLDELQEAHTQLAAYAEQVEELTLTTERQRMARELHDTLAQGLTGLVLQLEAVSTHINQHNNDRAQQILQDAMNQSRTTLAEARMVIDDLRTGGVGEISLERAVRQEASRFEDVAGIPCRVKIALSRKLAPVVQDHLLKVISEGLNNIARHAGANQAWLNLTENQSHLILEIEDDGRGFMYEAERGKEGHYGLLGIEERVGLLNGELSIDSQPEGGTCLLVQVPLDTQVEPHA
jgi:NarL family two-component system sensor histidine kinase YdfH